jgi:hypothetical protein
MKDQTPEIASPGEPLKVLDQAADLLKATSDPDLQALGTAITKWLAAEDAGSLDAALGLAATRGGRSWRTRAATAQRDELVRDAVRRFFPNESASRQAERLAEALARYRAGPDWRRDRAAAEIPYQATLRGHAWTILKARDHALSAERIRKILVTSSGFS